MPPLDPIPGRHPRLVAWAAAFRRAGYRLARVGQLFNIDVAELRDAGVS